MISFLVMHFLRLIFLPCLLSLPWVASAAEDQTKSRLKTESFDRDPGWDNSVNRVEASNPPTVTQDFGWSPGKIGGTVWQSTTPAWYGMPLDRPLSFKDSFSASGKIAVTRLGSSGVAYLGFFNHERQGWRPWSSMAMRLVNQVDKVLIYVDYMTGNGQRARRKWSWRFQPMARNTLGA